MLLSFWPGPSLRAVALQVRQYYVLLGRLCLRLLR
jgi:hypothetical protein